MQGKARWAIDFYQNRQGANGREGAGQQEIWMQMETAQGGIVSFWAASGQRRLQYHSKGK